MITNLIDGFIWNSNIYRVADIVIYTNQLSSNDAANVRYYLTRMHGHWWQTEIPVWWLFIATAATAFAIWIGIVLKRNS